MDVHRQIARVREEFAPGTQEDVQGETIANSPAPKPPRKWVRQSIKVAIGVAMVAIGGIGPLQRLFEASSVDAVVNARVVTLRAPIDGTVQDDLAGLRIGQLAHDRTALLHLVNDRADRSRYDDLRRLIDQVEAEKAAMTARLDRMKQLYAELTQQTRMFRDGRIKKLEEQIEDLRAQVSAARAAKVEAAANYDRNENLFAVGAVSQAGLDVAKRNATVTAESVRSLEHRYFSELVELEAIRQGAYIGDSYNDRPTSRQQADELSIRIAETEGEVLARDARLERLRRDFADEQARYTNLSDVTLSAPVSSRVWEVLVSPGEAVTRGQDMVRLLDCSASVVTATVRESVFNRLHVGDPATFRLSGRSANYDGVVVRMSGVASAPGALAIHPAEPTPSAPGYKVMVSVPALEQGDCKIGRTGQVVFAGTTSDEITGSIGDRLRAILPGF